VSPPTDDAHPTRSPAADAPRLSVVLPVRNGERYLDAALESVLAQTFREFELLALDDGSTDSTPAILERHAAADARVRVVPLTPRGQARAMNVGVARARAAWIARMDADDVCEPQRFARQMEHVEAHPELVVLGTQFALVGPDGERLGESDHPLGAHEIRDALRRHVCAIGHPTAIFRRDAFLRAGAYRDYYSPAEDYELWLRMSEIGELANLPDVLLRYRMHPDSLSSRRGRRQVYSVLAAAHAWREALPAAPDGHLDARQHSRQALRQLGVRDETVDDVVRGFFEWQARHLARLGDVESVGRALAEGGDDSPAPTADDAVRLAGALAAAGRADLALATLERAAQTGGGDPLDPRFDAVRRTLAAERDAPLRAVVVASEGGAETALPAGLGAVDFEQVGGGGRRLRLGGWGELRCGLAGYALEIESPVPGEVRQVARAERADVARDHGVELLLSGFAVEIDFGATPAPDPGKLAVWLRSAPDSRSRLPRLRSGGAAAPSPARHGAGAASEALERLTPAAPPRLGPFDVAAFLVVRDELAVLPGAFAAQRALGVRHFFVVDNNSTDGTLDWLRRQPDVTAYRSRGSFGAANFGLRWLETLLDEHARDRWALVLDADETFVYPHGEEMAIGELARFLSRTACDALEAVVVDMYSDRPIAETHPIEGRSLLEICGFLDAAGYYEHPVEPGRILVHGGPRARLFWPRYSATRRRRLRAVALSWNEAGYLADFPDVAAAVRRGEFASGWDHLLRRGRFEARRLRPTPHATWDEADYRRENPDVDAAVATGGFSSGLEHYLLHGQFEGRAAEAPPLLTTIPFVYWRGDLRFGVARHTLEGARRVDLAPIRAAILHFKLLGRLAARAAEEAARKEHWQEGSEYARYAEVLRRRPGLTAWCEQSVPYAGSRQLELLDLIKSSPALDRFAAGAVRRDRAGGPRSA
jgi:glycosyltransferase involved in cell wall biosynthesis